MKTSYRILIVDDEDNVRRMLATAFSLQGHETHCASNGQAALQHFADTPPDVVLMDIRMPVLDGIGAARELRALDREDVKDLPIIAMTANAGEEDRKQTREAGMNEHLAKPIDPKLLYTTLQKFILP